MDLIELARMIDQNVVVVRARIPIIASSRGGDTDNERPEVKLSQSRVRHPFHALQVRGLRLSNLDIGGLVPDSAHLRLELVERHTVCSVFFQDSKGGWWSDSTTAGI